MSVRGRETIIPITADIAWKVTVHWDESERVLKILAPVKTWKPTKALADCSREIMQREEGE